MKGWKTALALGAAAAAAGAVAGEYFYRFALTQQIDKTAAFNDYTIPRTVRELQPECGHESANGIIPYQELPGVYQRGETPATYPFFQNKMRALFSAFSLFFACT